ncbi:MAG: hypothetical protein DFNUSKGM_000045 [Candidatus Fervidibacter sacchari]
MGITTNPKHSCRGDNHLRSQRCIGLVGMSTEKGQRGDDFPNLREFAGLCFPLAQPAPLAKCRQQSCYQKNADFVADNER